MIIVNRILRSSLKHVLGKYLKDKSLLDNLQIIGKQIELHDVELDTQEIYNSSKKYLHNSFKNITITEGIIDNITISLSKDIIDNIYIDGVHVTIQTSAGDKDLYASMIQSHLSSSINEERVGVDQVVDSIFEFENSPDMKEDYSDSSDNFSSEEENELSLKKLFSKSKRNIKLITKILKQFGDINIVISNVEVSVDDFAIYSKSNKIMIRYNSASTNKILPFDYVISTKDVKLKMGDKVILEHVGCDMNIMSGFAEMSVKSDMKVSISEMVLSNIIMLVKHVSKPLKRIKQLHRAFKKEVFSDSKLPKKLSSIKTVRMHMKKCELSYPDPVCLDRKFKILVEGINVDIANIPTKTMTARLSKIQIIFSKHTFIISKNIELGLTYIKNTIMSTSSCDDVFDDSDSSEDGEKDQIVAQSPFEDDKVRLFNTVVKPHPIAPKKHRQSYTDHTQKNSNILLQFRAQYTNMEVESVDVLDEFYKIVDGEVKKIIDKVKEDVAFTFGDISALQESIFEKDQTFTIDTCFSNLTVKEHTRELQIVSEQLKMFCSNRYWFGDMVKCELMNFDDDETNSIASLSYSSFAGSIPLQHLSLDTKKLTIFDLRKTIELYKIIPFQEDNGIFDFYFRIFKLYIYLSPFYLKMHKTEVFNSRDVTTGSEQFTVSSNKMVFYRQSDSSQPDPNVLRAEDPEYQFLVQLCLAQYTISITPIKALHKLSVNDIDLLFTAGTEKYISSLFGQVKDIISSMGSDDIDEQCELNEELQFNIIDDYSSGKGVSQQRYPIFECDVLKTVCTFVHNGSPRDQAIISLERMNFGIFEDSFNIGCKTVEVIDRLSTSVWNKAISIKDIYVSYSKDLLSIITKQEIRLNVDQDIIIFFSDFIPTNDDENGNEDINSDFCIHISKIDLAVNYKHKHTPRDSPFYWLTVLNFIPIRNSKVHIGEFDAFKISNVNEFYTQYLSHLLKFVKKDLGGLIKGIKPIQPMTNVISGGCKMIFVPVNVVRGHSIKRLTDQVRSITKKTSVSILEIGASLQTADYYGHKEGTSVFADQPKTIKGGLIKGTKSFTDGMTTIVTFITDDKADLLQLPSIIVKPFTGFLANTFLGACNQIDSDRYQRMKDKYK